MTAANARLWLNSIAYSIIIDKLEKNTINIRHKVLEFIQYNFSANNPLKFLIRKTINYFHIKS